MSIFSKLFNGSSSKDEEIKQACDSDILKNIVKVINDDKTKFDKVLSYLTDKGDISMKLRVMTLPICSQNALMAS